LFALPFFREAVLGFDSEEREQEVRLGKDSKKIQAWNVFK
jgi:hypothetical protein